MRTLRVAVIGAGHMGRIHLRELRGVPGAQATLVVDPALGTDLLDGVPVVQGLDAAELGHVDCAVLAAPSGLHEPIGLELARRGIPTLVEKPLALGGCASARVAAAFRAAGTPAAVGHVERFNPVVAALHDEVGPDGLAEVVGQVIGVHSRRVGPYPERVIDVDVVSDLLVHDIDLVHWLVGGRYDLVRSRTTVPPGRPCADHVTVRARLHDLTVPGPRRAAGRATSFGDAVCVHHEAGRMSSDRERWLRVDGTEGSVLADLAAQQLFVRHGEHEREVPVQPASPLARELTAWCEYVRTGEPGPTLASLEDGTRAVAVADAVLHAASVGETITVEEAA